MEESSYSRHQIEKTTITREDKDERTKEIEKEQLMIEEDIDAFI
jgi:hypothetical protein